MAHYAFLNDQNVVVEVITGIDEDQLIEGLAPEDWYANFRGMKCLRTSFNTIGNQHRYGGTPFRKNYACIGYFYDEASDAFVAPQPFESWSLDDNSFIWIPPVPYPEDGKLYEWDESVVNWVEVQGE